MVDDRVRELERRWRATGAQADEEAWLQARLRAGELEPWRVEVAAHCAHPAAVALLGVDPALPATIEVLQPPGGRYRVQSRVSPTTQWAQRLGRWGREPLVRALVSFARRVQADWLPGAGVGDLERTLRAVEDWLVCPCPDHARVAHDGRIQSGRGWGHVRPIRAMRAGMLGEVAALAIGLPLEGLEVPRTLDGPRTRLQELLDIVSPFPGQRGRPRDTPEAIFALLASEVIPWALRTADPVADRVASREPHDVPTLH
jgi:hypothetical protein